MTPNVWIAKPQPPKKENEYIPANPVEKVSIIGDISTNSSRYDPKKPYTAEEEVWVKDKTEAKKLEPFVNGRITRIKGDEKGAYNGSKERDVRVDPRINETLKAVHVNKLA